MHSKRYICIHGHFYQPPRENPWLEEIELQDSAYPYHDWNERINAECYSPNTASRTLDFKNRIVDIVNNYEKISFNFGPTLLSWMQKHAPETYQKLLDADKESQKKFSGHGSAISQAYGHIIMPLANSRDERTQVIWGIVDFEARFGRKPEGMWLPETAVSLRTLEALVDYGIKFTILAPHQAHKVRKKGDKEWVDVSGAKIDPKRSYDCLLPSGRSISLFFYDGPIAQDGAFGNLLNNGEHFAMRLVNTFSVDPQESNLAHIATDGETYGHHHRYGEMALSYCLNYAEQKKLARITVYGEYLEKHPSQYEVEIFENTSWSCSHGIKRWQEDCGCNSGGHPGWNQKWREPLREALDWLRDALIPVYEEKMRGFSSDPWNLRDLYIKVILNRDDDNVEKFFAEHCRPSLSKADKVTILKLLEMQRHCLLMYTSCGWFFDEITGIETRQVLCYASRAIQLAKELSGLEMEPVFLTRLQKAPSNLPEYKDGAEVYRLLVNPSVSDLMRVGAHYAVSSLFEDYSKTTQIYCYTITHQSFDRMEMDKNRLCVGKVNIRSNVTWEEEIVGFSVLHLGDHNLLSGVHTFTDDKNCAKCQSDIREAFKRNDIPAVMRLIEEHFPKESQYSLWHLFKDEQCKILYQILDTTLAEVERSLRQINEFHYPIMKVIKQLHIPLPGVLANTVLMMLNKDLLDVLGDENINFKRLEELVSEVKQWSLEIDRVTLGFIVKKRINHLMEIFEKNIEDTRNLELMERILHILTPLSLNLDLWKVQNTYFFIAKKKFQAMKIKAQAGDQNARHWIESFNRVGEYLYIKTA